MNSLVESKLDAVRAICDRHNVKKLEFFGSSTGSSFDESTSDLDFLVEFKPMSPVDHSNCYFSLLEDLQALFNRRVDLVETNSISNPYFKSAIETSRMQLYAA